MDKSTLNVDAASLDLSLTQEMIRCGEIKLDESRDSLPDAELVAAIYRAMELCRLQLA
jgi:hypothetical protein